MANNPVRYVDPWGYKPGDEYESEDEAASAALNDYDDISIREDREYMGWVYQNSDGTYSYTRAKPGSAHKSNPPDEPDNATGYYHTHGAESGPGYNDEKFSRKDKRYAVKHSVDAYLETPIGKQMKYDYSTKKVIEIEDLDSLISKEGKKAKK